MHKSEKTFELLHFRKIGENTAEVMLLAVLVDHGAVAISNIYYGDASQPSRGSRPIARGSSQQTLHSGTG